MTIKLSFLITSWKQETELVTTEIKLSIYNAYTKLTWLQQAFQFGILMFNLHQQFIVDVIYILVSISHPTPNTNSKHYKKHPASLDVNID